MMEEAGIRRHFEETAELQGTGQVISEEKILERIFMAIMEQRLPPGTKLSENALCDAFGVSRARIRRVLLVLAERDIVEIQPHRGAFVARPSPKEARDVFQARRAIEASVVRNAVQRLTDLQTVALKEHLEREIAAERAANRHEAIRLSGEFHVKLAQFARNPVLSRFVEELVARTSLIIGLFGSLRRSACSENAHRALIDAISDRDAERAADLMMTHLDHIESELDLREKDEETINVRNVLKC